MNPKIVPPDDLKYVQVVKRERKESYRRLRKMLFLEKASSKVQSQRT